ncbi:transglutaminaseTgpA domain-containing protein [Nocardioides plantarum]|uniref:TransglutaminaseTgpA domain-containing protein n=1 Tax=Nocardioides plantarum TaxID=29299 RepID=A0ABV5K725_9ACTN|nr:transglutaminase domain-containing protein [Nocardioides plantarum]
MSSIATSEATTESLPGRALRLLWPVALLVLGALVLATAWHRLTISLLFAVVAALPLLLLRGLLRVGMSRWFASSMIVLLSIMGAYLATSGADLSLEQTIQDVVPRLLTAPQPYAARADLLVGPLLLTALVSVLVGLRVDSRLRVEPVVGAAVLYLAGMLLTAGDADPAGLVVVLLLVVALLGWVFLDEHGEPVRQRLALAGPVSVVGVGALAAIATLPVGAAFEPREMVDPPVVDVVASNPLTQLGAWANNPDQELLRVRGPKVPLRLVVLDKYDGTQWTSATRFEQVRSDGRTGIDPGPYPSDATLQVQFSGLGGSWLPSPGTPLSVALDDVLVDPATGTLFSPDGTDGLVYEVAGSYDSPPSEDLNAAQVPEDVGELTELPPLPKPLADFAGQVGATAATPYQRASAIESLVRDEYKLSPTAISGSALWRLDQFLLGGSDKPGGGVGTSEQFASAFALLARYNGLPTRVVVGFRPGTAQDDGTRVIKGEDAFAWAEVYFRGLGWVPFSPTPDDDTFSRPRPIEATEAELPEEADTGSPVLPPSTSATPSEDPQTGDASVGPDDADAPMGGPAASVLLGAGLALVVVVLVLLRTGRRVRHQRRGPTGAWAEVVDAMRLSGLRPAAHQPADVVAAGLDARLGTSSAAIASRAELATFGPPTPSPSPDADRTALRTQLRDVRRRVRRETPLWRRWWWWLDPRVLRRS